LEITMWPGGSPTAVNGAAGLIIVALIIAGLYVGRDLLIPLALAGLLSLILAPLLRRLTDWGVPRGLAVALVIAAVITALTGGITLAGREVAQLVEDVPRYESTLRDKARFMHSLFGAPGIWQRAAETLRNVEQEVRDPETETKPLKIEVAQNSDWSLAALLNLTRSTLPSIQTAALALLFTIFILLQYGDLRDRTVRLMGTAEIGRSTQALSEAGSDLAQFFLLHASLNAAFGVVVGVALWAIGIPSPGLWGAIAAVMRFVPYIGSLLAAAFPIALAAMVDSCCWRLTETALVFIIGEPIVGQIIEPLLFGSHTSLSPIAVLIGAAFWTLLWGPVGLILAVPLTLAGVAMGQHLPRLEFLRILLGNEPVLAPCERLYRQLLAGDAADAARDFDRRLENGGFVKYLDEVAIPSLRLGSEDRRRGVLGADRLTKLKQTLDDYVSQLRELLDFWYERQQLQARGAPTPHRQPSNAAALVIAGRGILDQAAAELVAEAVRFRLKIPVQCPSLGGLTGIGAFAQADDKDKPDLVLLISVGEVTPMQLDLLLSRISRVFTVSTIILGNWGGRPVPASLRDVDMVRAESAAALIDMVGSLAAERANNPHARFRPRETYRGGNSSEMRQSDRM
jgi:predicted PurR-regulated permease PerM